MAKKISTSKERIVEMMTILNIKQVDIVKRTGIPKSSLSNYLSGKRTPNQEQLSVISDPYGINPAWLMGYDVPMFLKDTPRSFDSPEEFEKAWEEAGGAPHPTYTVSWPPQRPILSDHENKVIMAYRKAPESIQEAVDKLLDIDRERKESASCG